MKDNQPKGYKANPTIKIQERILGVIRNSENPVSITGISKISGAGFNETKASVKFLGSLGVLETIVSASGVTLVQIKNQGAKNATA